MLFLRDWRSALVVVLNIPLSILAAMIALWVSGQTVNLMTLGGLALAVGILVDEATVDIENIHSHLARGAALARASYDRQRSRHDRAAACSRCSASSPSSSPAFFMQGAAQDLFVPLALAVGFAMVASYMLSSTLVPVLLVWVLRTRHNPPCGRSLRDLTGFETAIAIFRLTWCGGDGLSCRSISLPLG